MGAVGFGRPKEVEANVQLDGSVGKLTCKRCDQVWDRLWAQSDAWERTTSNETQLFSEETDQCRGLVQRGSEIEDEDPIGAFRLYLEAAECGSVWSMEKVGWHYWTGTGIAADPDMALQYYHRAIGGGSWMATISYAQLLAELGHHDDCESTLKKWRRKIAF